MAVIHCTELPDLDTARQYAERIHYPQSATGNCGHYYIDRDGDIDQYVPPQRVAHHVRGYNQRSVGIELINLGRYPHWHDSRHQYMQECYALAQVDALLRLLSLLQQQLPRLEHIAGHQDLDSRLVPASDDPQRQVPRKQDPGPWFPWPRVLQASGLKRLSATPLSD